MSCVCLFAWQQEKKLKIPCVVWEAACNEMRRDSSEMNPGWSLASANQITTKGSEASDWEPAKKEKRKRKKERNKVPGWKLLEWSSTEAGRRVSAWCLIGNERAAGLPVRAIALIASVVDAPAGVSRANAK